jgi:hypothetical protein
MNKLNKGFISSLITSIIILTITLITYPSQEQNTERKLDSNKVIAQFIKIQKRKHKSPVEINKVIIGDINGDSKEDQVIKYDVNVGHPGNATISFIAVFLNTNGTLKYLTKMDAGVFGNATGEQLSLDKIENQVVYCTVYDYAPNDGVCCPSIEKSYKYTLSKNKLKRLIQ